jgi:dipeptidyl-peptidase-3
LIATFCDGQRGLADLEALQSTSGLSSSEFEDLLQYTAQVPFSIECNDSSGVLISPPQVLSNLVNYRSFGFTKIIPRISSDKFAAVVTSSPGKKKALPLWNEVGSESLVMPLMRTNIQNLVEPTHIRHESRI